MPHSSKFVAEMKQKLLETKAKLEEDLKGLSPHTEMGADEDENAEEVVVDEVNQNLIARMQADLEKIKAALKRIESGTYGHDAQGNEISEDRLRALPWAETNV